MLAQQWHQQQAVRDAQCRAVCCWLVCPWCDPTTHGPDGNPYFYAAMYSLEEDNVALTSRHPHIGGQA